MRTATAKCRWRYGRGRPAPLSGESAAWRGGGGEHGYRAGMTTTDDIRRWAMALPEVEETSHFRFHVPLFKVRGRTFVGTGKDGTTAVFCVSEQQADQAAAGDPGICEAVRRRDARRSFFGLQVALGSVPAERVHWLVDEAWRQQAPKRLVLLADRLLQQTIGCPASSSTERVVLDTRLAGPMFFRIEDSVEFRSVADFG